MHLLKLPLNHCFVLFMAMLPLAAAGAQAQPAKPNVLIIYTDDQGYGDVSALNPESKVQTPNMDRIADEGVVFTRGHSADAVCTPSRYALLTGRYPLRSTMKVGVLKSDEPCLIREGRETLATLLKNNGYHTAMVGKWHLGMDIPGTNGDRDWSKPIRDMPLDKGFDYFYGVPASLNFGVLAWFEGRHAAVPPSVYTAKKKNPRASDYRIAPPYERPKGLEVAEDFIDNQCLTRFTDKAIAWMDGKVADSKAGKPFLMYLPYTSPHFPICPLPEFQGQGQAGAYGEFLIETDHHIGRVLDFLETSGIADDTLVVFTSDNGPEGVWRRRVKEFGHDSRGGLRDGKRWIYEGGTRVPFLVRWPNGIAQPGRTWDKPVGQVDLLATFADLLNVTLADDAGVDSVSFADVLRDPAADYDRLALITQGTIERLPRYAITVGKWKLILPGQATGPELYDLEADRAETTNVAQAHPEQVEEMTAEINRIIASGRTTDGPAQANDTGHWKELYWMSEAEYEQMSKRD